MIRRDIKGGWILYTQHNHANLAGSIMEYWGNDEFCVITPFDEVIFAIKEHDSGWKEWDKMPRINTENNYPANFMEMHLNEQHEIWTKCFERHSKNHKYSSALIALHFAKFNQKNVSSNPNNSVSVNLKNRINNFVSKMLKMKNIEPDNGNLPDMIKQNLKFVQIGDIISLALCHGWSSSELTKVPVNDDEKVIDIKLETKDGFNYKISPYPFSKINLNFVIRGKRLLKKTFDSNEELRKNLANSQYESFYFTIS